MCNDLVVNPLVRGQGWKRVASVTTGGRSHFWYRRTNLGRQWVVWRKDLGQWIGEFDYPTML